MRCAETDGGSLTPDMANSPGIEHDDFGSWSIARKETETEAANTEGAFGAAACAAGAHVVRS